VIFGKNVTTHPNIFIQRLHAYSISRLVLVPSLLKAIFDTLNVIGKDEGRKLTESVRLWVCSGETLSMNLLQGNSN